MVLQNIHGMPQSDARAAACALSEKIKCNKNQICNFDKTTGEASCVCKDGFIKNTNESAAQKCLQKTPPQEENQDTLWKIVSKIGQFHAWCKIQRFG